MVLNRSSKMLNYINYRMKITLQDKRTLIGTFMAFDKHMNLVLGDCEEFRSLKSKTKMASGTTEERVEKRMLGLVLLRGENIISLAIEGPPPPQENENIGFGFGGPGGPGISRAAGRGLPVTPLGNPSLGLIAPVRGIGGAAPGLMQPGQIAAQALPQAYGRGAPPPGISMGRGGILPRGPPPPPPPRGPPGVLPPGMVHPPPIQGNLVPPPPPPGMHIPPGPPGGMRGPPPPPPSHMMHHPPGHPGHGQ